MQRQGGFVGIGVKYLTMQRFVVYLNSNIASQLKKSYNTEKELKMEVNTWSISIKSLESK